MPSPQPKPVAAARATLPTDLDALVREALSGGDISKLRSAMAKASTEPGSSSATPDATPLPATTRAPRPVPPSRLVVPRPPVGVPPPAPVSKPSFNGMASGATASRPHRPLNPTVPLVMDESAGVAGALHEVAAAVRSALAVQQNGEPIHPSLDAIQQALDHARALAPPPPDPTVEALLEPLHSAPGAPPLLVPLPDDPPIPLPVAPARERPPVLLPKYRRRWLLVIQGPGDAELTQPMARALGVDGVSARFAAIARAPRVVLRRDTPDDLRQAAVQVQKLGVAAVVVSRDELESIASPDLVLASDGDSRLSVSAGWPWDADLPDSLPADTRSLPLCGMAVAVPGEVSVRRYRIGRSLARGRRSERVLRLSNERRFQVIDLHGPGRFLRLVAGVTNTSGMPGHDGRSALRSFQGLQKQLDEWIRNCAVQSDRVCSAGEAPQVPDGHDGAAPIEASGWAAWEEHTRLCRLLGGLSSQDVPVERA